MSDYVRTRNRDWPGIHLDTREVESQQCPACGDPVALTATDLQNLLAVTATAKAWADAHDISLDADEDHGLFLAGLCGCQGRSPL